jgi:16S rRNA (adenine1518-N6/adenine1519-N6)-dimethyltransferase
VGRRLGQHFLHDPAILDRIVEALRPRPDDRVIEIGPGTGTLTRRLAPRVGQVVAIDRDAALVERLTGTLPGNCKVVAGDALEIDWGASWGTGGRTYKAVGNIPYAITTPLVDKALADPAASLIVFLVQREVGDRLEAAPGTKTYGALSVGVQAAASVDRLFAVKPGSFRPPPKVESVVVRLTPLPAPLVSPAERESFRRFVAGMFGQRRRQLVRALRTVTGWEPDRLAGALDELGLGREPRPEVLTPQEFVDLFRATRR